MSNLPSTPSNARAQHEQDRIKVAVRMRPHHHKEVIRRGDHLVIEFRDEIGEVLVNDRYQSKKYSYDNAFGPGATQKKIFNNVVTSTLDEVLKGYSCTIFAYGQTGTGKTYTMEGERSDDRSLGWEDDPVAGIIPRTVAYFYDRLRNCDYSIRVSYLEIYNENLTDLLSARDGTEVPLKICVNTAGIACVQNLTEHMVRTKEEVFELLQRGSFKRRTAETKMNERSSRSHAVFMLTLVMQQKSDIGEEVVKTGKLYLVDLAGSENISRSGAQESRAQEAGNINKSLLTLGRVITALVERKPHIPYRDSKLTRLLQDSLGGRNKTTVIATISPAVNCLDETLSTLDYAFKAKNILNKPEVNQRVSKDVHVKEVYAELEKAKRDLEATWAKMGVTLSKETYNNMQEMLDARRDRIQALEMDVQQFQTLYQGSQSESEGLQKKLAGLSDRFDVICRRLKECRTDVLEKEKALAGMTFIAGELRLAESMNVQKYSNTVVLTDEIIDQLAYLHERFQVRCQLEADNQTDFREVSKQIAEGFTKVRVNIEKTIASQAEQKAGLRSKLDVSFSESGQQLVSIGDLFKTAIHHMDSLRQCLGQINDKLQYGEATKKSMGSIIEKFANMMKKHHHECVTFMENVDSLCRETRSEAEMKRDSAVHLLANSESKTIEMAKSFKNSINSSTNEARQEVEQMKVQVQKVNEVAQTLNEVVGLLNGYCEEVKEKQQKIEADTLQFQAESTNLAQANKEETSRYISQIVDSLYSNLSQINAEVHDHAENRLEVIKEEGKAEITNVIEKANDCAAEMDSTKSQLLNSATEVVCSVEQCGNSGVDQSQKARNDVESLSEFIEAKLTADMAQVQQSLDKIEQGVELTAKIPSDFIENDLRVYQPSGRTPKPQSWQIDREPVVVPSNDRLLATFRPPSELIATAEALQQADEELMEPTSNAEPLKSSQSEVLNREFAPNALAKAQTITFRRGPKVSLGDDKEN